MHSKPDCHETQPTEREKTKSYTIDASPTAYVFRCFHCGQHIAYADCT